MTAKEKAEFYEKMKNWSGELAKVRSELDDARHEKEKREESDSDLVELLEAAHDAVENAEELIDEWLDEVEVAEAAGEDEGDE